jgi:nucleotide-binding universal stress UspA family protein
MRKMLVAYDESRAARRQLERAVELANAFDAKVIVTSVAPVLHGGARGPGSLDPVDPPAHHEDELREAHAYFTEHGVDAELVPAVGDPAPAIVKLAEDYDVDVVVVGTREPGLVERVMRHSVSQEVARRVHRDLFIVHPEH